MRRKKEEGFSYMEVMVSLAVLGIVSTMIYQSIHAARGLYRRSSEKIQVTQLSESMLGHFLGVIQEKDLEGDAQIQLTDYLATDVYTKEWLEKQYQMDQYGYHLSLMPLEGDGKLLEEEGVPKGKLLSTEDEFVQGLFEHVMKEEEVQLVKISETAPKKMGTCQAYLKLQDLQSGKQPSVHALRMDGTLLSIMPTEINPETVHFEVSDGASMVPVDAKVKRSHMPLVVEVDLRSLKAPSSKKVIFTNSTTFPVVFQVQQKDEAYSTQVEALTTPDKGHVTVATYKEDRTPVCAVIMVVTKKGEPSWHIVKKQIGMVATRF